MKEEIENKPILWTKNYTIMTLGSVISLMGNYIVSFLLSLIVLEKSDSVFLYGLYWTLYYTVKILSPVLCGPMIDRLSKQKIIYIFDFLSTAVFLTVWFILGNNDLNFSIIYGIAIYLGFSDSCYHVAFTSLYPSLVQKGQLQKAYAIYSMLDTSAGIAVPIGALLYKFIGARSIFIAAAICYFIAAVFETIPQINELSGNIKERRSSIRRTVNSLKEGFDYLKTNKTIFLLTMLIMVQMFSYYNDSKLLLPFCRQNWDNSYLWFIVISGAYTSGYFFGGFINSKIHIPYKFRYKSFMIAFFGVAIIGGIYYFFPRWGMIILMYWMGIMSSTLYSLRMSTVQGTIDDEFRGRYNGVEASFKNIGMVAGTFISGCLAEFFPIPFVVLGGYGILIIALIIFFITSGNNLKVLFNKDSI